MMVKAGKATDAVITEILPLLDKGDTLIDGGNTNFHDTIARNQELAKSGINFIGMGVSGGELGALQGPSLMPGGQKEAYDRVAPILEKKLLPKLKMVNHVLLTSVLMVPVTMSRWCITELNTVTKN